MENKDLQPKIIRNGFYIKERTQNDIRIGMQKLNIDDIYIYLYNPKTKKHEGQWVKTTELLGPEAYQHLIEDGMKENLCEIIIKEKNSEIEKKDLDEIFKTLLDLDKVTILNLDPLESNIIRETIGVLNGGMKEWPEKLTHKYGLKCKEIEEKLTSGVEKITTYILARKKMNAEQFEKIKEENKKLQDLFARQIELEKKYKLEMEEYQKGIIKGQNNILDLKKALANKNKV